MRKPSARDVQRRLALVPYLQSKQGVSVEEVAREFGVKPGVVRRDVEQIMLTGVGAYGGDLIDVDLFALEGDDRIYISNADFMSRPLRIDADEAAALIVALRTLRDTAGTEHAGVVDTTLAKLQSAVAGAAEAENTVAVVVEPVDPSVLGAVREALSRGRSMEIVYAPASRDALTTRRIDPLATFTRDGREYLDAWCHRAVGHRFFRLDRIERAEVLDDAVADRGRTPRPVAGFFSGDAGDGLLHAELAVEPSARWIVEHYDAEVLDDSGDTWRVQVVAADESWVCRLALRAGGAIRVLSPDSVRTQVREHALTALAAYDEATFATEES
ncbi:MAG: WYL domain-containing protein [Aeromicrobium sp.]|uniref:helix-turn-helix transcriptional regulator n=1 Tax=Aeromicrobium sp. TaxID=1871063 RepID=UPI0039E4DD7B